MPLSTGAARLAAIVLAAATALSPALFPSRPAEAEREPAPPPDFTYSIFFSEAGGLRAGHPATYHGVPIGEVVAVELTPEDRVRVTVRLDPTHKARVHADSTARVVQESLVSVTGDRALEITNGEPASAPIAEAAEIQGVESWGALQIWIARHTGKALAVEAKAGAGGVVAWAKGLYARATGAPAAAQAAPDLLVRPAE
ncbi:MAG: MCE family protein [Planctomycetes bacterium]|nr:MCE family protein [Planctomycetota bacterium]